MTGLYRFLNVAGVDFYYGLFGLIVLVILAVPIVLDRMAARREGGKHGA